MVVAHRGSWNKLDADTQLLIKREAAAAEEKGWMLSRVGNIEDKKAVAKVARTITAKRISTSIYCLILE